MWGPAFGLSAFRRSVLLRVAEFGEHLVADIDPWRGEDHAAGRGTIDDHLVALVVGNLLDSVVDLVLDGLHQALALLIELALGSEIFPLQILGRLFLLHDLFLALGFHLGR